MPKKLHESLGAALLSLLKDKTEEAVAILNGQGMELAPEFSVDIISIIKENRVKFELLEQVGEYLLVRNYTHLANEFFKTAFYRSDHWRRYLKNDLFNYFQAGKGSLRLHKWIHYFEFYDRFFSQFRGKAPRVLEIGVFGGGSLHMWQHYFGTGSIITGIDIKPECNQYEADNVNIYIGDQADTLFLDKVTSESGPFDIIIDDGGHTMKQQIVSFEHLIPHISDGGVYLVEDCHTSYWPAYGGGYRLPDNFIEYSKRLVDELNAYHIPGRKDFNNYITKNLVAISFFDSIVVFEKRRRFPPFHEIIGG